MSAIPIPTRYKGYHFRSRLEARWAVCFEELHIRWAYEDEGCSLPSGQYLPDFKIDLYPSETVFVEIKGASPLPLDLQLCRELCAATNSEVWLMQGTPSDALCRIWRFGPGGVERSAFGTAAFTEAMRRIGDPWENLPDDMKIDWFRAMNAGAKARSARFEHGQSGPT